MRSTKSADLIGHDKFLSWRQLDGCSVTRPFLSPAKGVACETRVVSCPDPTLTRVRVGSWHERLYKGRHPIPWGSRDRPPGRKANVLDTALANGRSCVFSSTYRFSDVLL